MDIENKIISLTIEELLENIERQKKELEDLCALLSEDEAQERQSILALRKKASARIQDLEKETVGITALLREKEIEIEKLLLDIATKEGSIKIWEALATQRMEESAEKDKIISKLEAIVSEQVEELKKQQINSKVIKFIRLRCVKAFVSSQRFWQLRSRAALYFLEFSARIFLRYKILAKDEIELMFPKKIKKIPQMEIKIPTPEEKKEKLRNWKRLFRWKKV